MEVALVQDYLKNSLQTIEQNTQTINSGISSGSKKGNAIAASMMIELAAQINIVYLAAWSVK